MSWLSWPGNPSSCWKREDSGASLAACGFPPSVACAFAARLLWDKRAMWGGTGRGPALASSPSTPASSQGRTGLPVPRQGFYICLEALCCVHTPKRQSHKNNTYPFELQNIVLAFHSIQRKCQW